MRKEENMYTKSTFHGSEAEIKFINTTTVSILR